MNCLLQITYSRRWNLPGAIRFNSTATQASSAILSLRKIECRFYFSGIPGVDNESFGRVELYILEDPDIRPKRISRLLHIVGTKGKAQITFRYVTEGRKILGNG